MPAKTIIAYRNGNLDWQGIYFESVNFTNQFFRNQVFAGIQKYYCAEIPLDIHFKLKSLSNFEITAADSRGEVRLR